MNGAGVPKALRVPTGKESAVIHRWLSEGVLCEAFAAEVEKRTQRKIPYRGESMASFANRVFVQLLQTPKHRRQLGEALYKELWAR